MFHDTLSNENLAKAYLDLFKISEKKYLIGVFHKGITVYKQQVRALNLFQALVIAKKIPQNDPNFVIGIIGSGIAGITFASAAAQLGLQVQLIEKYPILMPMQYGCDTRIVHPNIYEWPDLRSEFPYAEIPILSWKSDTASNVAKQIVNGFHNLEKKWNPEAVKILRDTTISEIETDSDGKIRLRFSKGERKRAIVDFLIFATGYGIEKGVNSASRTPSYWRNDDFAQPRLGKQSSFFISGVGDGGLIDLFRLKIRGFSYESFLAFAKKSSLYNSLVSDLRSIKLEWIQLDDKDRNNMKDWLYLKLEKLNHKYFSEIVHRYFKDLINKEIIVKLHGKENSFRDSLSPEKTSMLNALLAYGAFTFDNFFEFKKGKLTDNTKTYFLDGKKITDTVLIRQGPNRNYLEQVEDDKRKPLLAPEEIVTFRNLESSQKADKLYNTTALLWSYESLNALLKSETGRYQFLSPETTSVCSSFVAVIAEGLKYFQNKYFQNSKYRICLHRVVKYDDSVGYQQITEYFGDSENEIKKMGRVFPSKHGLVGLALLTGKPLVVTKKDSLKYEELLTNLKLVAPFSNYMPTAAAIPILAKDSKGKPCTNLICYLEAEHPGFFLHPRLGELLELSIQGFMKYILKSIEHQDIRMEEVAFDPTPLSSILESSLVNNPCLIDVLSTGGEEIMHLTNPQNGLIFDRFLSFDVTYGSRIDYLH